MLVNKHKNDVFNYYRDMNEFSKSISLDAVEVVCEKHVIKTSTKENDIS